MNYGRQLYRCTANWMAILTLATIAGCHVTHSQQVIEAPCPPPVYMEYPYFGYHPTCWTRWPADWIGCPPEDCLPVIEGPAAEIVPLPADASPLPPMPPVDETQSLPPVPPGLPEADVPPELPPATEASPQSSRIKLRMPAQEARHRALMRSPLRTSLSTYTSSPKVASCRPEPRRVYGLARMARQAAVRRGQGTRPTPPSINELVGAESDDGLQFDSTVEIGAQFPTASAGY